MDILNKIKRVQEKNTVVRKHPLYNRDAELKYSYLSGVALVMEVDEIQNEDKYTYFNNLMKAFNGKEELKEQIINFAHDASEDEIENCIKSIVVNGVQYNFIIDCILMALCDEELNDKEKQIIKILGYMLYISEEQMDYLIKFTEAIKDRDKNGIIELIGDSKGINVQIFKYYMINVGILYNLNLKGYNFFKGENIDIIGNLLVDKSAELNFEGCTVNVKNGRLISQGKLIMKNCNVNTSKETQIVSMYLDFNGCSFKFIKKEEKSNFEYEKKSYKSIIDIFKNFGKMYSNKGSLREDEDISILILINNSLMSKISNCQFKNIVHEFTIYAEDSEEIIVENSTFKGNRNSIYLDAETNLQLINTIFKDNIDLDLEQDKGGNSTIKIKNCLFERGRNNDYKGVINVEPLKGGLMSIEDSKFINTRFWDNNKITFINCQYL